MGTVRAVALGVLLISFLVFVAFFGRLPALRYVGDSRLNDQRLMLGRNTPIGTLHRVVWLHIPSGFRSLDQWLTNGRLSTSVLRIARTLWYDRHPIVMVRKISPQLPSFVSSYHFTTSLGTTLYVLHLLPDASLCL